MYEKEFILAKKITKRVGRFLKKQEVKKVDSLVGRDIKLALDRHAEKMILEELQTTFDYPILTEETGTIGEISNDTPFWIVDPIDGTMNFSKDCPIACVSIALWREQNPLLGVVYDFYRNELFSGLVGEGAWLDEIRLKASDIYKKSDAVLATGFPTYMNLDNENFETFLDWVKKYKKIRMFGSAALSLCYVASGRVDAYRERNIKLWDIAAGVAINKALNINIEIINSDDFNTDTFVGV